MTDDPQQHGPPGGLAFGGTIFLEQSAHVAILDAAGRIIAVNTAWEEFGRNNGLDPAYGFGGADYLDVCARAAAAPRGEGNEGAADALDGLRGILASREP